MSPKPDQHYEPKLRGFTIVELLIVIAVIILLLSILIVAVNAATRTAQSASTRTLMNSMKQALVRFKADIGYYPPVLGDVSPTDFTPGNHDLRKLFDPRGEDLLAGTADDILPLMPNGSPNPNYSLNVQAWYSVTTPADYLIGYGNDQQDAYDGLGIRHPGPDAVWEATIYGAADGSLGARNAGTGPASAGKVYGQYLELKDERLLASTNGTTDANGNLNLFFPGEGNYNSDHPKIIVDYWGNPIRYYRKVYPTGALQSVYRSFDPAVPSPTLSDVFVLRPFDLKPGSAIDGIRDDAVDSSTTHALRTAEFALLSAGPDRALDESARRDPRDKDEQNKDNIVELGP